MTPAHRLLAGLLAPVALLGTLLATAPAAHAAARVDVQVEGGTLRTDGPTTLTVRGSGFQSVQGGFGGIYVVFGWVDDPRGGTWRPSNGGQTGEDLRYVPDSESADNAGHQRFVAFPGSDTAAAANGGVLAADGSWSTTLVVPGARFSAVDRSGAATTVDCTTVTCGVITLGAHGVKNAANETFTPLTFGSAPADPAPAADAPADATAPALGATAVEPVSATVGVDRATAVVGRAMGFTGQGFLPGEQVVGTVDDGRLAVGPLTAGMHGEVAGFVELPADLRAGTHVLRLTGAGSGAAPQTEFTATKDPAVVSAQEAAEAAAADAQADAGWSPVEIAVGVAALVLLAVVVSSAVTAGRRRTERRRAASGATDDLADARAEKDHATVVLPTVDAAPAGGHR